MLVFFMVRDPRFWIVPLLILIVSYAKLLHKMGKWPDLAIVPVLAEKEMSYELFRHRRSFWGPAIVSACIIATAVWIGTDNEYGLALKAAGLLIYGIFIMRLYWRLGKQFGRGFFFRLCLVLIPLMFLPVLAFGKSAYLGRPEFKPEKVRSPKEQKIRHAAFVGISLVELLSLLLVCFGLATIFHPARPIAEYMLRGDLKKMESIKDSKRVVSRRSTLGKEYASALSEQRSRDYFFPDHSNDKKVVVMEYIIGSNLEDDRGSASINIAQMKDATAKGDGVDFVIQAGGSDRWFTKGIDDSTVGRYLISGGELTKAEMLSRSTCMSEPERLTDFIKWAKENYPADRYMLVLWDHGGGFASGFGVDDLNKREGSHNMITASEVINAIRDSGVKFDLLGFDACLMQNIEYANALEPYADYYLASQETEPAYGWYYTVGFGKLAEDPTLSTEELGRMIVSTYDKLYRKMNNGEPKPENTLSLVDLTLVKPVYQQLTDIYDKALDAMKEDPAVFANISAARSKAYQFYDKEQADLINFATGLKKADYKQTVASDEDLDRLVNAAKACVVYRNRDAADGINGISMDFPYSTLYMYSEEYEQLQAVEYKNEEEFLNNFCSIMASQQARQREESGSFFDNILAVDMTGEKWYIEGFEDYDTTDLFIDIPVKAVEGGYLPELPEKTWDTILDTTASVYMVTEDGLMYLGRGHYDAGKYEGHTLVAADDRWVAINGQMVNYVTGEPVDGEEGTIYKGTVKARLNDKEDITIHIEWDPVKGDEVEAPAGHVTGYSRDNEKQPFFMKKGLEQFKTGDKIEFLFDIYDEEGKLKDTKVQGSPVYVVTDQILSVKDVPFENGTELEYYGILTDVYQRELMTEAIREKVEDD